MLQSLKTSSFSVLKAASCSSLTSLRLLLPEETLFPSPQKAAERIKGAAVVGSCTFFDACWWLCHVASALLCPVDCQHGFAARAL